MYRLVQYQQKSQGVLFYTHYSPCIVRKKLGQLVRSTAHEQWATNEVIYGLHKICWHKCH